MITVTVTAHCLRCDWTAGPGDMAAVDRGAEKHTRAGHATATAAVPASKTTAGTAACGSTTNRGVISK
jgi:hypothetical protein